MQVRTKAILVALAVAIPAFALGATGPVNQAAGFWGAAWPWGGAHGLGEPSAAQLPFFIVLAVLEAVALGAAVAFLLFAWPAVRRVAATGRGAVAAYLSAAWVLGNWWLHDGLHVTNGEDLAGLLVIEYAFHVTLVAAGFTLCWQLYRAWAAGRLAPAAPAA